MKLCKKQIKNFMTINVITLQGCPKCAKIKNLLAQNNIEFKFI